MNYLSVCSGIEAATVAWHPLGWKPFAFAEIEKFPRAVLAHHYPHVPNLGDMTKFRDWPDAATIDLLVGGTPCQSFSVAGLRKGMADPRGNLALTYLAIADRYRPEWLLWENVPGVLSSSEGRDFGAFIGGLGELGYHAAWRVLDAQYVRVDGFARAVPQRRRRVFVVGHLGDWRRAAAVLFERESLLWDTPPRREAGQRVAPTISARPTGGGGLGTDFDCDGGLIANPLRAQAQDPHDDSKGTYIAVPSTGDIAHCLNAGGMGRQDYETETVIAVAHALRGEGFDASEDGTGRGTPIVPVVADTLTAYWERSKGAKAGNQVGLINPIIEPIPLQQNGTNLGTDLPSLRRGDGGFTSGVPAVAFQEAQTGVREYDTAGTLRADGPGHDPVGTRVRIGWAVRRLTPLECERLQGFPDGYTAIPKAADGPRYKALGNSMAVNAMRWLGRRIDYINSITRHNGKDRPDV